MILFFRFFVFLFSNFFILLFFSFFLMKRLLFVGVDPGTTVGFAILDIDGSVVDKGSFKGSSFSSLVSRIISSGVPLVVATDKSKVPSFVLRLSSALGARVWFPRFDVSVSDKRSLVSESVNDHVRDSLAAVRLAFKSFKPLIDRVRRVVPDSLFFDALLMLFRNPSLSISEVVSRLSSPVSSSRRSDFSSQRSVSSSRISVSSSRRSGSGSRRSVSDSLLDPVVASELFSLRERVKSLSLEVSSLRRALNFKAEPQLLSSLDALRVSYRSLERRFFNLKNRLSRKDSFLRKIALSDDSLLLLRVPSLANRFLKDSLSRVLFVDDPNVVGSNAAERLFDEGVSVIVFKKQPSPVNLFPFIVYVPSAKLSSLVFDSSFVLVDRKELYSFFDPDSVLKSALAHYSFERSGKK